MNTEQTSPVDERPHVTFTRTRTTHTVVVESETPMPVRDGDDTVHCTKIEVSIHVNGRGQLLTVGTNFICSGAIGGEGGRTTRRRRSVQGSNLARIPESARAAVIEAMAALGVEDDGQIAAVKG